MYQLTKNNDIMLDTYGNPLILNNIEEQAQYIKNFISMFPNDNVNDDTIIDWLGVFLESDTTDQMRITLLNNRLSACEIINEIIDISIIHDTDEYKRPIIKITSKVRTNLGNLIINNSI